MARRHAWEKVNIDIRRSIYEKRPIIHKCPCGLQRFTFVWKESGVAKTIYSRLDMSGHTRLAGHCTRN